MNNKHDIKSHGKLLNAKITEEELCNSIIFIPEEKRPLAFKKYKNTAIPAEP